MVLIGTDFEVRVWETLLAHPAGPGDDLFRHRRAASATDGRPRRRRRRRQNPISFVVPCHRVLGRSGALTGYHWGLTRKQAILGWEAGVRLAA